MTSTLGLSELIAIRPTAGGGSHEVGTYLTADLGEAIDVYLKKSELFCFVAPKIPRDIAPEPLFAPSRLEEAEGERVQLYGSQSENVRHVAVKLGFCPSYRSCTKPVSIEYCGALSYFVSIIDACSEVRGE